MAVETAGSTRDEVETRYCTRHPDRETLVACGRCERPFCTQCLVHTPAGQRCYECAGVRRDYAQRANAIRLLQGFGIAALGSLISTFIPGLYGLLIAGLAGSIFGQTVSPSVNRHTKPWIWVAVVLALYLGAVTGFAVRALIAGIHPLVLLLSVVVLATDQRVLLFALIAGVVAYLRMR